MARNQRRKAVQALVKSALNSKAKNIQVELQKQDIQYCERKIKEHGGR